MRELLEWLESCNGVKAKTLRQTLDRWRDKASEPCQCCDADFSEEDCRGCHHWKLRKEIEEVLSGKLSQLRNEN